MSVPIGGKPAVDGFLGVHGAHVGVGGHAPVGKDGGQVEMMNVLDT